MGTFGIWHPWRSSPVSTLWSCSVSPSLICKAEGENGPVNETGKLRKILYCAQKMVRERKGGRKGGKERESTRASSFHSSPSLCLQVFISSILCLSHSMASSLSYLPQSISGIWSVLSPWASSLAFGHPLVWLSSSLTGYSFSGSLLVLPIIPKWTMEYLKSPYPNSSRKSNILFMVYIALPNLSHTPIFFATSPTTLPGHLVSSLFLENAKYMLP